MSTLVVTLFLGFILGIKHAFEPDHVIAVSTIVSQQKNPFRAALIGTFWGIGHTTILFIIGIIVLLLKISIPEKISMSLEMIVGVMLIILGLRVFKKDKSLLHYHKHHVPFFVGLIHGLAGSGVLMLLILSTVPSLMGGLYYILFFGMGSILGMSLMSFAISIPFSYSTSKFPKLEKYLRFLAGALSITFGSFIVFNLLFKFFV